jgi:DNA-binding transcriptional regulator YiaG
MHLVNKVCKEYKITQSELSKMLDIPKGTISRWVSTGKMPKTAKLPLELMLQNRELEKKLNSFKIFKKALEGL